MPRGRRTHLEALDEVDGLTLVAADDEEREGGLARRRAHRTRPMGDQVVAHLLQVLLALAGVLELEYLARGDLVLEELGRQEVKAHAAKQVVQVSAPMLRIVLDPLDDRLEHYRLAAHAELVALEQLTQLLLGELEELLAVEYVREVGHHEAMRLVAQTHAAVGARELGYAYAVVGVHVLVEEDAGGVDDVVQLQHLGGAQQLLHIRLGDEHTRRVDEVDDEAHDARRDLGRIDAQLSAALVLLAEAAAEHGAEVGRRGRQHQLVGAYHCLGIDGGGGGNL